jgi:ubiquitin carboxyl-terminal hydrolase 9/24
LFDNKLLHQLGLQDEQDIIVKKMHSFSLSSNANRTSDGQTNQAAVALKEEKTLPGVLLVSFQGFFEVLEDLASTTNAEITAAVRSLLMLIPTNPQILKDITSFAESGHLDEVGSRVIEKLFDHKKNSPTQLLYNFEVLSSRVLPVREDESESSAGDFKKHFLKSGGLQFVLNILQREALPCNVELGIRQDCYAITLSLARFLLCNQTSLPSWRPAVLKRGTSVNVPSHHEATATPPEEEYEDISDHEDMVTDIDAVGRESEEGRRECGEDRGEEMARLTIETMHVDDFSTMLAHLIIVAWAAAAGRLHLAGSVEDGDHKLVLGLCVIQKEVSGKDAAVARAAMELLVTCLELRVSLLGVFFSLKQVGDFIIDVLVGSAHPEVRTAASVLFSKLSHQSPAVTSPTEGDQTSQKRLKVSSSDDPRKFFIHTLLNVRIPVWTFSPLRNEVEMRWRANCIQYFDLLCGLLEGLSEEAQEVYGVNVSSLLENELQLVDDVYLHKQTSSDLQNLIAGHLNLLRALYSCDGVNKAKTGPQLVHQILSNFLFPASSHMLDGGDWASEGVLDFTPVCEEVARVAAFKLLIELADGCPENVVILTDKLAKMHHMEKPHMSKEWEFQPPVIGRAQCGFVGLRNGGATCYMNSVLQQLYMQPRLQQMILTTDIEDSEEGSTSSFLEIQKIFGHLLGSKLQSYIPDGFWRTFKLWGQPVNIREQQDAFEFFSNLAEQADEVLKKNKLPQIFSKTFGGVFLDEKICRGCEHRYEREELFQSISLTVTTKVMEEALKEYFKGELLEGDNAYNCEKCDEKRDALKRTSIKTLPPVLVIHLKRFGYDWEAGRAIKCDDHFEFPLVVDMLPFTAEGIEGNDDDTNSGETPKSKLYRLTGIVVHSGQASAGHYYSFIKQRKVSETDPDKWYRFNDNLVDEVVMDTEMLELECFGGTYKSGTSARPESRTRFWNAYMLFYKSVEDVTAVDSDKQELEVTSPLPVQVPAAEVSSDLKELDALVKKGEGRKMFEKGIPSSIQRSINEDNLLFMQNKEVYTPEYWKLIKDLVDVNIRYLVSEEEGFSADVRERVGLASFQLGINFLLHTYIRTKKKLRSSVERDPWLTSLTHIMNCCPSTSKWFLDMLSIHPGCSNLQVFFLDCPSPEMRFMFAKLLLTAFQAHFEHKGDEKDSVDRIVDVLLGLLQREVVDSYRFSTQYFEFLREYSMHEIGGPHLLQKNGLMRFITFLMEPPIQTQQRSWAPQQVREFRTLFAVIGNLMRQIDLTPFCKGAANDRNPYGFQVSLVEPTPSFQEWYKKQEENRKFVKELVLSLREADSLACDAISATLCYCCYDNEALSAISLDELTCQVSTHTSNELKQSYKVLMDIMLIRDPFQTKRIKYTIEGSKVKPDHGIFNVMDDNRNKDSRRTYQAVKFIIHLANRSPDAGQLISKHYDRWQWSVEWLKKKIRENYSSPSQTSTIVSNETSSSRTFQRTVSAQNTLEEATVLLSEIESQEHPKQTDSQSHEPEDETGKQIGTEDVIG